MEPQGTIGSPGLGSSNQSFPTTAWLDAKGAARRASVSAATIAREARAGRLRAAKVGGRKAWRFRPEWIDAWLEQTATPVEVPDGKGRTR